MIYMNHRDKVGEYEDWKDGINVFRNNINDRIKKLENKLDKLVEASNG